MLIYSEYNHGGLAGSITWAVRKGSFRSKSRPVGGLLLVVVFAMDGCSGSGDLFIEESNNEESALDACSLALGVTCSEFEQAYIKASNTGVSDLFGTSVALSPDGNALAVGAYGEDSNATGVGGNQQTNNSSGSSGAVYIRRIAP